jgi:hypothetical protein
MPDLRDIHEYLRPSVAKYGQRGEDRRQADELMRYGEGRDLEEIFEDRPKPEPRWLLRARLNPEPFVFWVVMAIGALGLFGLLA